MPMQKECIPCASRDDSRQNARNDVADDKLLAEHANVGERVGGAV